MARRETGKQTDRHAERANKKDHSVHGKCHSDPGLFAQRFHSNSLYTPPHPNKNVIPCDPPGTFLALAFRLSFGLSFSLSLIPSVIVYPKLEILVVVRPFAIWLYHFPYPLVLAFVLTNWPYLSALTFSLSLGIVLRVISLCFVATTTAGTAACATRLNGCGHRSERAIGEALLHRVVDLSAKRSDERR